MRHHLLQLTKQSRCLPNPTRSGHMRIPAPEEYMTDSYSMHLEGHPKEERRRTWKSGYKNNMPGQICQLPRKDLMAASLLQLLHSPFEQRFSTPGMDQNYHSSRNRYCCHNNHNYYNGIGSSGERRPRNLLPQMNQYRSACRQFPFRIYRLTLFPITNWKEQLSGHLDLPVFPEFAYYRMSSTRQR